jgi:retron-type reverse transcriptase
MDTRVLRQWLEAGFLEKQAWFATMEGTPQGGIISPVLANWTLDGLQRLLAERFANTPQQRKNKVHLVRDEPEKISSSVQYMHHKLCVVSAIVSMMSVVHEDKESAHKG